MYFAEDPMAQVKMQRAVLSDFKERGGLLWAESVTHYSKDAKLETAVGLVCILSWASGRQ